MKSTIKKILDWVKSRETSVKGMGAVLGFLLMLPAAQAQFTWPVYEPFGEYTNPPMYKLGENYTNFWNTGNGFPGGVSTFLVTNAAALTYPSLQAESNAVPLGVQAAPANTSADRGGIITPQTGTWYASFLLNYQDNGGATIDRSIFQMATGATPINSLTRVYTAVWLTPDYRLKVTKNFNQANLMSTADFSAPTPVLATNVTHLIVMRYLKVPGGQDIVNLWVDPAPFGDNANIPAPTLTTSNAANISSFNAFLFSNRKLNGASSVPLNKFQADEIRLASTWAEVTPLATPAPGPLFSVTGGGMGCVGDILSVGLSGSVTTNDYLLYTNNVYATTLAGTGSALDFGPQTTLATYSVLASNTINGNIGWMAGNTTVAIKAPAAITTEPIAMTVATNSRAEFRVSASGDFITLQWYKDGAALADDSHITGSATGDLAIWPATAADIGGYYCRVSDTCGNVVYSTTNALNLSAPNDLVWAGDAFSICVWDVFAANTEWSGGTGYFSPGDNVTFDDTYSFANAVALNGVLVPGKITVNASRDYRWAGTGYLAGSAALVKDGAGTLILENNSANFYTNTFTGGTIISNGVLNITNGWCNLGSGPVTLAGGTLANWNKGTGSGAPSVGGLPNNVTVTANSTWRVDRTGDQCAGLLGVLNGSSGLTLQVTNSATTVNSLNRFRIGSAFTNALNFALSFNAVATGASQDIAAYNATGNQVYNGVISGAGCGFQVAGAGSAYLNGANTYDRYTIVAAGFLGGSGSINSALWVSNGATIGGGSPLAIGTITVNSNIFLNGNVSVRVDKALAQSNDLIVATGFITNGGNGTLTITNIGGTPIAVGDTFKIFSGAVSNGAAITVTDGNITAWANNLAVDGTVQALSVIPNYSTNISYSLSGNTLTITWPETHLGWILQSQTNSLTQGIRTNSWFDIAGSATGTSKIVTVNAANPTVFYRLRKP